MWVGMRTPTKTSILNPWHCEHFTFLRVKFVIEDLSGLSVGARLILVNTQRLHTTIYVLEVHTMTQS